MVRGWSYLSHVICLFVAFVIAQCRADPVLDISSTAIKESDTKHMLCPETLLHSSEYVPKKISTVNKKAINE